MPPGKSPSSFPTLLPPDALLPASVQLPRHSCLALGLKFSTGANLRAQPFRDSPDIGQEHVSDSNSGHLSGQLLETAQLQAGWGLQRRISTNPALLELGLKEEKLGDSWKVVSAEREKALPAGSIREDVLKRVTSGS